MYPYRRHFLLALEDIIQITQPVSAYIFMQFDLFKRTAVVFAPTARNSRVLSPWLLHTKDIQNGFYQERSVKSNSFTAVKLRTE